MAVAVNPEGLKALAKKEEAAYQASRFAGRLVQKKATSARDELTGAQKQMVRRQRKRSKKRSRR